ncbi:MAG TPA: PLP-dependent aspartate aminotransferase family protein [Pyrinomonadaceae bacterium]|nr:PLP-dependent aspartate aminotransferase family protein [Pyrinomonadaceae bacterium]
MTRTLEGRDITTQLVHAGERQPPPHGVPASTPVYATSTFTYGSMAEVDRVFSGEDAGYVYTRYGNPTTGALEEAIRVLEGGAAACAYATGMAALHAALFACELSAGSTVLASQDLYGATTELLYTVFGSFGVKTVTADFTRPEALRETALEVRPRVLLAETISNPLLKVCDINACAEVAREAGARLVVDNTFASPYLCRPLEHGADLVVHSATKYLGGHADVMGGLVVSRDAADAAALVGIMKLAGGVLGVWEAHEVLRGLKTLAVRLERQCSNARRLAERLAAHTRVRRVHYPGLNTQPEAVELLSRVLRAPHAGALVAIELEEDTFEAAFRFMDALGLCVRSTSLGDVFTGVLHPATSSHREVAPARRRRLGIADGLVRISVGIEDVEDVLDDIERALGE